MDRTHQARTGPTQPLARGPRTPQRIGFIGRPDISEEEGKTLSLVGRAIARLGHTLVIVPAEGSTAKVREGVEAEEGRIESLQTGVLETADHTLLYTNPQLLERIKSKYNLSKYRVTILQQHQLALFWGATKRIMAEQGVPIPE